jgi:hypothetical protein
VKAYGDSFRPLPRSQETKNGHKYLCLGLRRLLSASSSLPSTSLRQSTSQRVSGGTGRSPTLARQSRRKPARRRWFTVRFLNSTAELFSTSVAALLLSSGT